MPEQPTGTITFLFTDIEGSTRLWERGPEAMKAALARHNALIGEAIASHGGYVFKTLGDAFCAAFDRATDAAGAACHLMRSVVAEPWQTSTPLSVRVALHSGEAEAQGGDYLGASVNRCARLLDAAHGGQILLSQATYELARDALPPGVRARDWGGVRLRDLARPEHVFQLLHPSLPDEFPALRGLGAYPNNLPMQLTSFIGRQREMAEVKGLLLGAGETPALPHESDRPVDALPSSRLVTLTGSGGCGKTRLALQVAADLLDLFLDGVWLVDLAPLSDAAFVPQAAADALGVREEPNRPVIATLLDYLRSKHLLLLLDGCEHLIDASARLAETVLHSCPRVQLLAVSREALRLAGEVTWRVPSLSAPDPALWLMPGSRLQVQSSKSESRPALNVEPSNLEHPVLAPFEAVQLFVERAAAALPRFELTPENARPVGQICWRLDGIPLALELAAARVKVLSVEEITARLDDRFRLLTGGSRTALPRQQTLRAAIDWSYDLLSEPERVLLRRLSVFAGGWTLEAAEAVCAEGSGVGGWGLGVGASDERLQVSCRELPPSPTPNPQPLTPNEVLDLLTQLVDKSLVIAEEQGGRTRYRLLETVREYSRDRLREAEEPAYWRGRHRACFLRFAERAETELRGRDQLQWLERLETEHDNLRAALDGALEEGASMGEGAALADGLRLAGALWQFWMLRGHLTEGRERLRQWGVVSSEFAVLSSEGSRIPGQQPSLPRTSNSELTTQNSYLRAPSRAARAKALCAAGILAWDQGDNASAGALLEESVALGRETEDQRGLALALSYLGAAAHSQGENPRARALLQEGLALWRETNDRWGQALALSLLGVVVHSQGDPAGGRGLLEQSVELWRELGEIWFVAGALSNLGGIAFNQGDYATARALREESLQTFRELGDQGGISSSLHRLAIVAQFQGDFGRARALCEESLAIRKKLGDRGGTAASLHELGAIALREGDAARARALCEESLAIRRELGDKGGISWSLHILGDAALQRGDVEAARALHEESFALRKELNDKRGIAWSLLRLADMARREGDSERAGACYRESLILRRELGDQRGIVECLEGWAKLAEKRGEAERATRMFATAAALRERLGAPLWPSERAEYDRAVDAARGGLDEAGFRRSWEEGRERSLDEAIAEALGS